MYTTCLFCHSDLGANEAVEHFPIGRRLAFDAVKGRLWVVCRKCERWNLTPLEDRWEAIEECERLFSSTRLRVSTDNIGMARVREGLELVRIGQPQRPEFAAWRYGDQFGRRRRRYMIYSGAGIVGVVGVIAAAKFTAGIAIGGGWGMWQLANAARKTFVRRLQRATVSVPGEERPRLLRYGDLRRVELGLDGNEWLIRLPKMKSDWGVTNRQPVELRNESALRVAGSLLPGINARGGAKDDVQQAVRQVEETPDVHQLFRTAARLADGRRKRKSEEWGKRPASISNLAPATALALEMAAHEDVERRAMEGELAILEEAWRQAEEIAGIADNLLVPSSVDEEYEKLKR